MTLKNLLDKSNKMKELHDYVKNIKSKIEQSTEYTLRTDFEILLNAQKPRTSIKIIQENKKTESQNFGRPDFKITDEDLELGWIETKPYHDDLSVYIDTPQLKRYLNVIPNLLFTNYREFILFREGELLLQSVLIEKEENKELKKSNIENTKQIISEFFDAKIKPIEKTEKLSVLLAKHARYLHNELDELWNNESETLFKEKFKALYELFLETLIKDLKPSDFIDSYAQTVTYGLLLSALSANQKIDKTNFINYIPKSLSIFEEIFGLIRLSNIPDGISWIIDKLFVVLNHTDYSEVQKELSFAYQRDRVEDPYIYFYENFLKAYNPEKRVEKGVYYTPASVVHFIVKSIQQSLIEDFKKSGLDDDDISLLDFATGTGTFLLEAYRTALENVDKGQKNQFIRNNLLNHFFGFEYLIAPYIIAHLKLITYLTEEGFKFEQEDRVKVYLTDTLDDTHYQRNSLFPHISNEGKEATKIKLEKKIWVVLGNPPYSNYSKNKKPFIQTLIKDYKKELNETALNLDDDYIKFLRFAQAKIEGAKYSYEENNIPISGKIEGPGQGIIGVITNNSYLNGVTHRTMRKSLLNTFDKIYIINLHGNSNIGEPDKNVFDVKIGVSIALFIKTPQPLKKKGVYYYSTLKHSLLKRTEKENFLYNNDLKSIKWTKLKPEAPYYWFVDKDLTHQKDYNKGWGLNKIFKVYSSGVTTHKDKVTITFTKQKLKDILLDLKKLREDEFSRKYKLPPDGKDWKVSIVKQKTIPIKEEYFNVIHYRPFDYRYTYMSGKTNSFITRPRYNVMQHFVKKENIGLIFPRNWDQYATWSAAFVTDEITDVHLVGGQSYIAPLYIYNTNGNYDQNGNGFLFKDKEKKDNFTKEFRLFLKKQNLQNYVPEQILGYIYAIIFCPTYREKYFEFFKIDFPKIPFTEDVKVFKQLSALGFELIEHHLLKYNYAKKEKPVFAVEDRNKVDGYFYDEKNQRLYINKVQYFERFPQSVWEYEIGGYQVIDKYLKSRKKLCLTYTEVEHVKKVSVSLSKTIELQKNIDELCMSWI